MTPTVLLATTTRWFPTARLAASLAQVGFRVQAVCPSGHPIELTGAADRLYRYRFWSPLDAFASALTQAKPQLVIPGDDLAVRQLYELFSRERKRGRAGREVCEMIERALGPAENFPMLFGRTGFLVRAREAGVRAPDTSVLSNVNELPLRAKQYGFPLVLKADGTSGGEGVRIVRNLDEAKQEFQKLSAAPLVARALTRTLRDKDAALLKPALLRQRPVVNVQRYVSGREGTSAIACWKGRLLASLHFEVLLKTKSSGHATVVRLIDNPDMARAAEGVAASLNLSGLHGLDFMIEPDTGYAHLIEINPRSTQVGHLALGPGRDLPAALYAAVSGEPLGPAPPVMQHQTIALFPQEWIRDQESPYLLSAYHDVPWQYPELVRCCVLSRRKQSGWYVSPRSSAAEPHLAHSSELVGQLTPDLVTSSNESAGT